MASQSVSRPGFTLGQSMVRLRPALLALALALSALVLVWAHLGIAALTLCLNETPVFVDAHPASASIAEWLLPLFGLLGVDGLASPPTCDAAAPARAMALAALAYLAALVVLDRFPTAARPAWTFVAVVAGIVQCALFFMPALLSSDILDYASHGRVAAIHGANPYLVPPSAFPGDPFAGLGAWASAVTVYGPLWTRIDATLTGLLPAASVLQVAFAYKLLALFSELASAGLIFWITRRWARLGITQTTPLVAVAAWVWNPLVNVELVGNAHNEAVMIVFVLLAFALLTASLGRDLRSPWRGSAAAETSTGSGAADPRQQPPTGVRRRGFASVLSPNLGRGLPVPFIARFGTAFGVALTGYLGRGLPLSFVGSIDRGFAAALTGHLCRDFAVLLTARLGTAFGVALTGYVGRGLPVPLIGSLDRRFAAALTGQLGRDFAVPLTARLGPGFGIALTGSLGRGVPVPFIGSLDRGFAAALTGPLGRDFSVPRGDGRGRAVVVPVSDSRGRGVAVALSGSVGTSVAYLSALGARARASAASHAAFSNWLWLAAVVCLWLGALVKFVPAGVEAIVCLAWLRQAASFRQGLARAIVVAIVLLAISILVAWPWLDSPAVAGPLLGLAAGGQRFKDVWQDAPAAWLTVRVVPLLGVPDDPDTLRMDVARTLVWGVTRTLFVAYVAAEAWLLWRRATIDATRGAIVYRIASASVRALLMAVLLYVSQVYAWYFLWPLPMACVLGVRQPWSRAAIVFGLAFLPAYYLREFQSYGVFYVPIYAVLALAILALTWLWQLPRVVARSSS